MSIKVMSQVWEHSRHKGSTLLLLLAIADFADDSGMAFPSRPVLAKKIRMSERSVQRLRQELYDSGELRYVKGGNEPGDRLVVQVYPKGDKLSARETNQVDKGDKPGRKRETGVSPYPSLEPSLTTNGQSSVSDEDFAWELLRSHYTVMPTFKSRREHDFWLEDHANLVSKYGREAYQQSLAQTVEDKYRDGRKAEHVEHFIKSTPVVVAQDMLFPQEI